MGRNEREVVRNIRRAIRGDRQEPGLGIAIGAALGAVLFIGLATCQFQSDRLPAERSYGTVMGLEIHIRKFSSGIVARVRTPEGLAMVSLPDGSPCRPGDRIELRKRGQHYSRGPGGCSRG